MKKINLKKLLDGRHDRICDVTPIKIINKNDSELIFKFKGKTYLIREYNTCRGKTYNKKTSSKIDVVVSNTITIYTSPFKYDIYLLSETDVFYLKIKGG